MASPNPARLVVPLRCYARRSGRTPNRYLAHCIDLDIWAAGASIKDAKSSLEDAILGYARAVLDTDDTATILPLFARRAPLRFVALWHILRLLDALRSNGAWPLSPESFEEPLPVRLSMA